MAIITSTLALSIRNALARPFLKYVSSRASSWRYGRIRFPTEVLRHRHSLSHGGFIPRKILIPRGGSSARPAAAAWTAAYADFFDDGMYSDSGGGGDFGANNGDALPPSARHQSSSERSKKQQYQNQQENQQQIGTVAKYNQQQYQQDEGMMSLQGQHGHGQLHTNQVAAHAAYVARVASSSRMNSYTVSLALRYACEINRKLRHGTDATRAYCNSNDSNCKYLHMDLTEENDNGSSTSPPQYHPTHHQQSWELQHHVQQHQSGAPAPVHHRQERSPPIRRPDPKTESLTDGGSQLSVFHAPSPRREYESPLRGVERWGIDLEVYVKEICERMDCSDDVAALVLARALIYLDRACSVETERQGYHGSTHWSTGCPPGYAPMSSPCPAILPRTVHRLILTAIVLSCRATRGQAGPEYDGAYCENFVQFGILPSSLSAMEATMRDALGMEGLYVDQHKLLHYLLTWGQTFTRDQHTSDEDDASSGTTSGSTSDEEVNELSSDDIRVEDQSKHNFSRGR